MNNLSGSGDEWNLIKMECEALDESQQSGKAVIASMSFVVFYGMTFVADVDISLLCALICWVMFSEKLRKG